MSNKTLSVKKPATFEDRTAIRAEVLALDAKETKLEDKLEVIAYTRDQLLEMLRALPSDAEKDYTMDLPTGAIPAHLIADKSQLPPVGERTSSSIQPPAKLHGRFDINGIPVIAPGVQAGPLPAHINPTNGLPFVQVVAPQQGGMISPPPSRNFK